MPNDLRFVRAAFAAEGADAGLSTPRLLTIVRSVLDAVDEHDADLACRRARRPAAPWVSPLADLRREWRDPDTGRAA